VTLHHPVTFLLSPDGETEDAHQRGKKKKKGKKRSRIQVLFSGRSASLRRMDGEDRGLTTGTVPPVLFNTWLLEKKEEKRGGGGRNSVKEEGVICQFLLPTWGGEREKVA